jgi:hypothetical protein
LKVWHKLIRDYPEIHFWAAQNKTMPIEILTVLAEDEDYRVRLMVASKNSLTKELLIKLAKDKIFFVRQRVAFHKKITRDILEILSIDNEEEIRLIAINRIKTGDYKN